MKIKLILVLSLLFNFIILSACGPSFWRQTSEDNEEFYAQEANREILREGLRRQKQAQSLELIKREKQKLEQNVLTMFEFIFATIHPSDKALTREVSLKIWKFVKNFPLEQ